VLSTSRVPKSIDQLEVLTFNAWWYEAGAFGLAKRNIDIYFDMELKSFQVWEAGSSSK
jgi:hypothetical protein